MGKFETSRNSKTSKASQRKSDSPQLIRLNKYLSECGIASRRHADELITEGSVSVNGRKIFELGLRIDPTADKVTVRGKPVQAQTQKVYILFNKPKNVVTSMNDPLDRPTVADYFKRLPARVFPVGRLDWDTEGMILLTNDGEFAQKVNHPSEEIWKTYLAKVSGQPSQEQLEKLRRGISIIGGKVAAKQVERIRKGTSDKYDWIKISISEGKNHQVRKMFEKIGFDVIKLQRVGIGRLRMPSSLKRGEYLFLTPMGIDKIFQKDPLPSNINSGPAPASNINKLKSAKGLNTKKKSSHKKQGPKKRNGPKSLKAASRDLASRRQS